MVFFENSLIKKVIPARGSFVARTLTLMTGTTIAQVLTIVSAPILTRLYAPENFGILANFLALSHILGVIVSWRYEMAIVLPEKDEEAASLLVLALTLVCCTSFATFMVVALGRHSIAQLLKNPELSVWLWFLPVNVLLAGIAQAFGFWNNRQKQFQRTAISRASGSIAAVSIQIGIGLATRSGPLGLIAGGLVGLATGTYCQTKKAWREAWENISSIFEIEQYKEVARKYRKFPQFTAINSVLNMTSNMFPLLLLSSFFGKEMVGFYFLGQRILSTPLSILGNAFSEVFFQKTSEYVHKAGDIKGLVIKTYKNLFAIICIPMVILFIVAPQLFAIVFGQEWMIAGKFTRIIIPWITIMFLVSPTTVLFQTLDKQERAFIYELVIFFSRLSSLLIGGFLFKDPFYTIGLFSFVGFCINIFMGLQIISLAAQKSKDLEYA